MFSYFANILLSPAHWLWDNVINREIYGVRIWQITFLMVMVSIFYRVFIIPTIGGTHFALSSPSSVKSIHFNRISTGGHSSTKENMSPNARQWAQQHMSREIGKEY